MTYNKIEKKVLETIQEYNLINKGEIIVVAVSGGPDSMCLLSILNELKDIVGIKKLIVAHLNHMLREEAKEETRYVEQFCNDRQIECYTKYVDIEQISKNNKIGTEEAGRIERYKFFEEVLKKTNADKIAIAHNKKDNVETVLMHLLRGSGMSGLCGIKPERDNIYIRPIIKCSRDEIEEYLRKQNIIARIDKSNQDNSYTRNKIRNKLIPYLEENYNPNIINTIDRLSEVINQDEIYMEKQTDKAYKDVLIEKEENCDEIDLKKFNNLDEAIKTRLIMKIIKKLFGSSKNIEKIHINDIIKLCSNNIGNKYLKPNKNLKVYIQKGIIRFIKE